MATPEGNCRCKCSQCVEEDHCDNPDTGCFITTGPDVADPLTTASRAERKSSRAEFKKAIAKAESDW